MNRAFVKGFGIGIVYFAGLAAVGGILGWGLASFAQPTGTNFGGIYRLPITTVANLPTCGAAFEGVLWAVTDQATAVAYNGAVTGGGANHQHVYCNGTAWVQQ